MSALKIARQAAGLTAAALAERANTFEMRIYHFERGRYRPKPAEAIRIAEVLHADPAELFPSMAAEIRGGAR